MSPIIVGEWQSRKTGILLIPHFHTFDGRNFYHFTQKESCGIYFVESWNNICILVFGISITVQKLSNKQKTILKNSVRTLRKKRWQWWLSENRDRVTLNTSRDSDQETNWVTDINFSLSFQFAPHSHIALELKLNLTLDVQFTPGLKMMVMMKRVDPII